MTYTFIVFFLPTLIHFPTKFSWHTQIREYFSYNQSSIITKEIEHFCFLYSVKVRNFCMLFMIWFSEWYNCSLVVHYIILFTIFMNKFQMFIFVFYYFPLIILLCVCILWTMSQNLPHTDRYPNFIRHSCSEATT